MEGMLQQAARLASRAVAADRDGRYSEATVDYTKAADVMMDALKLHQNCPNSEDIRTRANTYLAHAKALQAQYQPPELSKYRNLVESAQAMMRRALESDERRSGDNSNEKDTTVDLYTEAAALFLEAANSVSPSSSVEANRNHCRSQAMMLIERAEELRGINAQKQELLASPIIMRSGDSTSLIRKGKSIERAPGNFLGVVEGENSTTSRSSSPTSVLLSSRRPTNAKISSKSNIGGNGELTTAEINVLFSTSTINNIQYLPWLDVDLNEKFKYPEPWVDPSGALKISMKQKDAGFIGYRRRLCSTVIDEAGVSPWSVTQTVVSDCSFVASLTITAAYEKKFRRRVITSIIYPQDLEGRPIFNPSGKYMVKLHINGIARKVLVDDALPVDQRGEMLCSFSSNRNELWVSIIEKAYMKTMGGYDFPGSNSAIDLHALTGWIPERMSIDDDFKADIQWKRMRDGLATGDILVTCATGVMDNATAERTGLVPTHAYAVLDLQELPNGTKLVRLKNPWTHKSWKGAYSANDTKNWTPENCRLLNFNLEQARKDDKGVFWVEYAALCKYWDVFYYSWNPHLFAHRHTYHSAWKLSEGTAKKDLFNYEHNPQFSLEVDGTQEGAVVWVVLSKHITLIDDFKCNKDFITVHVYHNTNGRRVYYPGGDQMLLEGIKINSPHYLAKFTSPKGFKKKFTLIVSQFERTHTINYTLRCFCSKPFTMFPIPADRFGKSERIQGEWTRETAGGSLNHGTYMKNPQYALTIHASSTIERVRLFAKLEAPRQFAVNVHILGANGKRIDHVTKEMKIQGSDAYHHGFVYHDSTGTIEAGVVYTVVPSTFEPSQMSTFFMTLSCSHQFSISRIPQEGEGMKNTSITHNWRSGSTAAGCANYGNDTSNPIILVNVRSTCSILMRLIASESMSPRPALNISLFSGSELIPGVKPIVDTGSYKTSKSGIGSEITTLQPGNYIIVPSTFTPMAGSFSLTVYHSSNSINVKPVR